MSSGPLLRPFSAFVAAQEDYLLTLDTEGKSPETLARLRHAFLKFERTIGQPDPAAIDVAILRRFVKSMKDAGLSTSTQHGYLKDVKGRLKWLFEEGGYGVDAAAHGRAKPPRVVRDPIVPIADDELARLFARAEAGTWRGERLKMIMLLLLDTGIRNKELCELRLGDVDLTNGRIVIRPIADKTRNGRTIGLGKQARIAMGRWWLRRRNLPTLPRDPEDRFFLGLQGEPMMRNSLDHMIARHSRSCGVDLWPHRFRHTFAIFALREGMNPFVLMHTLGHTDLTMTKRYMTIVDADVVEQKRAKSPGDRLRLKL